jgi:tRNA A-37 threonylcarbamoyl transferase component Bud32
MREIKDTKRAEVHIDYEGKVHKRYRGPLARKRYDNEVRVLKYLETKGCTFVPKLIHCEPDEMYIVTTNCGQISPNVGQEKMNKLFAELETFGVHHGDAFARNITYDSHKGRFCIIDFEFSTILESGEGLTLEESEKEMKKTKYQI